MVLVVSMVGDRRILFIILLVLVVPLLQVPSAYSSEFTSEDKLFGFLSSVVGLDLTKYALIPPSIPGYDFENWSEFTDFLEEEMPEKNSIYPPEFGGLVEEEVLSYDLEYNESKIHIMSIFYKGHMAFLGIDSYSQVDYVYSESPPTDILNQTKRILQRYQTFTSQNYATDASYVVTMLNILSSVSDLSPTEITDGNVNFQVSKNGDRACIKWIYTEDGVLMNYKRLSIKFCNSTFESFRDTWGLYSVSGLSVISSEEAVQIALEAAQNCEIRIGHEDRETEIVKPPDLSNAPYNVNFNMVPFRYQESDIPSEIPRDPFTLYPYWQVHFYFNESIAGNTGIQVGVWGDTGEIIYCSGFGYLGSSGTTNEQDTTEQPPDDQPLDEQKQVNPLNPLTLVAAVCIVAAPIVLMLVIVLGRKNWRKQRI